MWKLLAIPLFVVGGIIGLSGILTIILDPQLNPPFNTGTGLTQFIGMIQLGISIGLFELGDRLWKR